MIRIVLGIALLVGVGAGGYLLGSRKAESPQRESSPRVDSSLLIPEGDLQVARQVETFDPVMFKMIESHFKEQADWKSGQ